MRYDLVAYAGDFSSFLLQNLKEDARHIRQVILFGSVARGEAGKSSDVDLFIEVADKKLEKEVLRIRDAFMKSIKVKKYWHLLGITNDINCTIGKLEQWKELAIRLAGHSKYDIGADGFHGMQITTSIATVFREKNSTGSAQAESGFTPEGAIGKTVGLSYRAEVKL